MEVKLKTKLKIDGHGISIEYQKKHIKQLIVRFGGCTVMLFSTGNFRVMGKDVENEFDAMQYVFQVTGELPQIDLQTMVATHRYPFKINLNKLSNAIKPQPYYNAEHFLAVSFTKYIKPMHVNVFASLLQYAVLKT
jgi:TATA-box binding protein (TBP) (component of TFIID and TFIIIB)